MRWIIVMMCLFFMGCGKELMRPDRDDFKEAVRRIADLPEDVRRSAREWAAARKAARTICDGLPADYRLGTVDCVGADGSPLQSDDVDAGEMCDCLRLEWEYDEPTDYASCWDDIAVGAAALHGGSATCAAHPFAGWTHSEHPDWEPGNISDEEVLRALLDTAGPPPWFPAGLIAEWAPFVCTLSTVGCGDGWAGGSSSSTGGDAQ